MPVAPRSAYASFADYYRGTFRHDLVAVLAATKPGHAHAADEVVVQPRTLSRENPLISSWTASHLAVFATALFLTVLADEVWYTYFRLSYDEFRKLTQYPKLRGDCPGGCWSHLHPRHIYEAIGMQIADRRDVADFPFDLLPSDTIATIRTEVEEFMAQWFPAMDRGAFWARCAAEMPPALLGV